MVAPSLKSRLTGAALAVPAVNKPKIGIDFKFQGKANAQTGNGCAF